VGLASHGVGRLSNLLPPVGDGALVGLSVDLLMAVLFWMTGGTLEDYLRPADQALVDALVGE
jgi:hypothetical protein